MGILDDDVFETVRKAAERSRFTPEGSAGAPLQVTMPKGGLNDARQRRLAGGLAAGAGAVASALGSLGFGGGSSSGKKNAYHVASSGPSDAKRIVREMAERRGWSGSEWDALEGLIQRESGWNPNAKNPTSSAAGLFQFLDSTRKNYGISIDSPLTAQIEAGLRYIADRYKSPSAALQHWLARKPIKGRDVGHWY